MSSAMSQQSVDTFKALSPEEQQTSAKKYQATTAGTLGEVLLKKIISSTTGAPGAPVFDTGKEAEILEQLSVIMSTLGLYAPKTGTLSFEDFKKIFQKLVVDVTLPAMKTNGDAKVNLLNSLIEQIITQIGPLINESRIPVETTLGKLNAFIESLGGIQQSPKDVLNNGKPYFGVYIPEGKVSSGSGHVTLAYSQEDKEKYLNYLGRECQVSVSEESVNHTDKATGKKYQYVIVKIVFADGNEFIGHTSIHNVGNEWGTEYRVNGIHQSVTPHPENLTWNEEFTSLVIPFLGNETLVTCDLDGTLFNCGDYYEGILTNADLLIEDNLTGLGKLVKELSIPFQGLTSRRGHVNKKNMEAAIKALFPACKGVSWGDKLPQTANTKEGEAERSQLKANDKKSRLAAGHWHFDDERIVIETIGFGSIVAEGTDLTPYVSNAAPSGSHKAFALTGSVGAGKTTLIDALFTSGNYYITPLQVGTDIDDGIKTILVVAGPDYAEKGDTFYHSHFAARFPERDTLYIFDSTGVGRKFAFPTFQLNQEMSATMFLGCYISLLNRTGHANLNGIGKVDHLLTVPKSQPWNTNYMCLTNFINHLWIVYNGSQADIIKALSFCGQTVKFTKQGDALVLTSSYREGQQEWNTPWGVQNRKTVHVLFQGKTVWIMLKAGMDAGSEMKPATFEGGDDYKKKLSPLLEQIRQSLFEGKVLPHGTVLTSKVDGSLIQVTLVNEHVEETFAMTMAADNTFVKMFAKVSYQASGGKAFMIFSSNGTLNIAKHMWDYLLSAMTPLLEVTETQIQAFMKTPATPEFLSEYGFTEEELNTPVLRAWSHMVVDFYKKLAPFTSNLEAQYVNLRSRNYTIQIEAICKDRTTCTGVVHTELAISYPMSGLWFLGIKCGEDYIPSSEIEAILDDSSLKHPLFWRENDSVKLLNMLSAIQRLSTDPGYTSADFIKEFPPNNKIVPKVEDIFIDHEGFILLVKSVMKWVYCKLKTWLYYIFHKLAERNVKQLIDLSCSLELPHFPLAKTIREHYETLSLIDSGKMHSDVTAIMLKYSPTAPVDDSKKETGKYNSFLKIQSSGKVSKLCMFLWNNTHKEMHMEVYTFIWGLFGASYIGDMYSKLSSEGKLTDDITDKLRKIDGSMKTLSTLVLEEFTDDIFGKFCSHMLFLQNDLPNPVETTPTIDDE
jgi:hypothetical protein